MPYAFEIAGEQAGPVRADLTGPAALRVLRDYAIRDGTNIRIVRRDDALDYA